MAFILRIGSLTLPDYLSCVYSGVDVFTALSGAVGALYGPLHGGANEVNNAEQ